MMIMPYSPLFYPGVGGSVPLSVNQDLGPYSFARITTRREDGWDEDTLQNGHEREREGSEAGGPTRLTSFLIQIQDMRNRVEIPLF